MSPLPSYTPSLLLTLSTSTLSLSPSHPIPAASPTSLLIAVHSTAITSGELTWSRFCAWPSTHIPCFDVSGTVLSPHPSFPVGTKVYGRIDANRDGAARAYASLLVSEAARVPRGLGLREACVVPMSAHTAWQAVFEHGLLTGGFGERDVPRVRSDGVAVLGQARGKRVLVLNASGGVGLMGVQFAKLAGAFVVGTASAKNEAYLKELGVDEVLDYHTTSIEAYVAAGGAKFDLVFDCAGGKAMVDGWNGVKEGGAYISVVPGFEEPESGKPEGVRSKWFVMEARGEELERIGKFFEKGMLRATVDSVWKLEEYEGAFAKTASGHARGKVVIGIAEE